MTSETESGHTFVEGPALSDLATKPLSTTRAFCSASGPSRDERAEALLGLAGAARSATVLFADQVHGANVSGPETAPSKSGTRWQMLPECDGLWTDRPDRILVVRTADCVPVVIAARNRPWVAAVHAGWRGTFERILETAIQSARESGIEPQDLALWIGPAISGEVYEVSSELADRFRARFADLTGFTDGRFVDLPELNRLQALRLGVPPGSVFKSRHCTLREEALFPSYRRDGECRGQIYTMIAIRGR